MAFHEKTIDSESLYEGKILNLRRDKVITASGRESYREIVEHRGAVGMIAITDEGKIVMVRQFRQALKKELLEIPAGKLEINEEPLEAAMRELAEETGYRAGSIQPLLDIYPAVGYSEECIKIYLCSQLVKGETNFDDSEDIEIEEYFIEELDDMILKGKIQDSKTLSGILALKIRMGKEGFQ